MYVFFVRVSESNAVVLKSGNAHHTIFIHMEIVCKINMNKQEVRYTNEVLFHSLVYIQKHGDETSTDFGLQDIDPKPMNVMEDKEAHEYAMRELLSVVENHVEPHVDQLFRDPGIIV